MKKIILTAGIILSVAFVSSNVFAQDNKKKETKPAEKTTQAAPAKADPKGCTKTDAKTTTKEGCKPGCTMHKDKSCDKEKKTTTSPDKK